MKARHTEHKRFCVLTMPRESYMVDLLFFRLSATINVMLSVSLAKFVITGLVKKTVSF
jgi:hypothetical protein